MVILYLDVLRPLVGDVDLLLGAVWRPKLGPLPDVAVRTSPFASAGDADMAHLVRHRARKLEAVVSTSLWAEGVRIEIHLVPASSTALVGLDLRRAMKRGRLPPVAHVLEARQETPSMHRPGTLRLHEERAMVLKPSCTC